MTQELTIRRYEPADAERVWSVHEGAFRASPLEFLEDTSADEDITEISARYLDDGGEFLVGVVDGTIVAIGGFRVHADDTVEIRRLRVHPAFQRNGYGERVLAELETRARKWGFDRSVLGTHEALSAAQHLYESHGYEESHRESHPATGDELVYYRKKL